MGDGRRYAAGPMVGERIIYIETPEMRKKMENELARRTKEIRTESEGYQAQIRELQAALVKGSKELATVTRDREHLANLKAPGLDAVPSPQAGPPAAEEVEKLRAEGAQLRDELAAARGRIEEMSAGAAVPTIITPEIEYRNVAVDGPFPWVTLLAWASTAAFVGAVIGKLWL